jgi:hypothetical protein
MIRKQLRRLYSSVRNAPGVVLMTYTSMVFVAVVFFSGVIYFFAPIDLTLKHWVFALACLIIIAVAVSIYMHVEVSSLSEHIDASEQVIEHKDEDKEQTRQSLPPKPSTPPTISLGEQSETPPADKHVTVDISSNPPPRRGLRRRKKFRTIDKKGDVNWLTIHTYTPVRQGMFKKKLWKHKTQMLELDDNPDVDIRHAIKAHFLPTDGETKIYCLQRLHWWSHGPGQLGILLGGLVIEGSLVATGLHAEDPGVIITLLVTVGIGFGIAYYLVRMPWAHTYLIFTNRKIRMPYRPPFNLPSSTPSTDLTELTGGTNPSSSWWGNTIGYGKIRTETVASEVDKWLLEDVKFVKNYERVALRLDQLKENAKSAN